jgi:hypothetical protein
MGILTGPAPDTTLYRKGIFDPGRNPDIDAQRQFDAPPGSGQYVTLPPNQSPGPQLPPRGAVPSDAGYVRLQFPPRLEKLDGSVDFRKQDYHIVLPIGATVQGPSFQVPEAQVGWLQNNDIYVLTPTAATDFSMTILINDGPVPGFDDIRIPPGIALFALLGDDDMRIRIPNHGKVSLRFTNRGTAEVVGGLIQGWFHPLSAETFAWGGGS